ncbi:metallophosphoesterase, partial [Candidatus Woesearchaeota archaeon]|nr:metallophosphoesterase [Candidatus Woesearchaeota archaeon]
IGAWREPKLAELNRKAFISAVDAVINEKVDFVLISGDLFNTSLPSFDSLKETVAKLKQLADLSIPVYIIAGSHDFSPSGKTMLDVLEHAGLCINVARGEDAGGKLRLKITVDQKTGAKITGMIGKKGMLEKEFYELLDRENLENEDGFKIFMLHTALTELKPAEMEKMDSAPISLLPKGFDYYAAGHVHVQDIKSFPDYKNVVYPGPLFPNNFAELEKGMGSFCIYEDGKIELKTLYLAKTFLLEIDCEAKTPDKVNSEIEETIKGKDFTDTIILMRLSGKLSSGRPSDIGFKNLITKMNEQGAYFVMKNTSKLTAPEFEEVQIQTSNIDEIEEKIIQENLGQFRIDKVEKETILSIMNLLNKEKDEGETNRDFEERVRRDIDEHLEL